jgi:hypothetical protein
MKFEKKKTRLRERKKRKEKWERGLERGESGWVWNWKENRRGLRLRGNRTTRAGLVFESDNKY